MRPLNQQTTKKTTLVMLILAWVLALILAFPNLIVYQFNIVYDAGHGLKPYCMTKELELEWPPVFKTLFKVRRTDQIYLHRVVKRPQTPSLYFTKGWLHLKAH